MNEPNESGIDAGERWLWDQLMAEQDEASPVLFVCFGCSHTFSEAEMDDAECPSCGSDDFEHLEEK